MMTIFSFIFVLAVLIFVHELGHFLAARSVGVRVKKFSLGFPPRIISFIPTASGWIFRLFFYRKDDSGKMVWGPILERVISRPPRKATDTEYCIALVPLGGYVKMAGALDESLDDTITGAPDELLSKSRLQQAWVMISGVLMNIILAVLVFAGLTFIPNNTDYYGIPEFTNEPVVMKLNPGFPAEGAGIYIGDRILSINGEPVATWEEMTTIIHARPNERIYVEWQRGEEIFSAEIMTNEGQILDNGTPKKVGLIGMRGGYEIREAHLFESLKEGVVHTGFWFGIIVKSIKMIITGEASAKEIGGPILIGQMVYQAVQVGFSYIFPLMAIISVNLAFLNILPIPVLDGGHLLIILIESITRREISVKARMIIQQIGMAFIMLLILFVLYNDISRLISN